jgi:hypothetical protein
MSRLIRAQQLLNAAAEVAQDDATKKIVEAVTIILDELGAKERKESDARVAPNAVRKTNVQTAGR